ncbi:MAG TPA: flippase [Patescibacteria group bacterium]|nr:flippase [Patescibacteria group bacterium]
MTLEPSRIAKNTIYLTVATVGQKFLAFFYFALIARMIGVENTGKYFFVVSLTIIFSIFIDLGLSSVLTREIAKNKEKASEYLGNILTAKIFFFILTYFAVALTVNFLGYSAETKNMVYLAGIVMFFDSFHLTFYAVFRGLHNLKYEAMGVMVGQLVTITFGGLSLFWGAPLYFLIIALILGSAAVFVYSGLLLRLKTEIRPRLNLSRKTLQFLFKIAYPFALAGIFVKVYSYLDSILLSKLVGDLAVGWWSVAYKITFAFQFIPMAFAAAMFPAMSAYFVSDKEMLRKTFERVLFYLAIIAVPLAAGIFSLAGPIILKIYGSDYAPSIVPLQILVFAIVFIFLNFPVGSLLNATDRQMTNTMTMGAAMFVNIILNILLIPLYSFNGAAISALASYAILFFLGLYFANKVIKYNKMFLLKSLGKIFFSALVMSVVVIFLRQDVNFLILIPLGAFIYFTMMFLTKGIEKRDVINIIKIFKKEKVIENQEEVL